MIHDNTEFVQFRVQNMKQGCMHFYNTYRMWKFRFKYPPRGLIGGALWVMLNGIQ